MKPFTVKYVQHQSSGNSTDAIEYPQICYALLVGQTLDSGSGFIPSELRLLLTIQTPIPGADPELVSRGRSPCRAPLPSPPHHPTIPSLPSSSPPFPILPLPPSLPFPLPLLPSLPSPGRGWSGGPPPENFEILDCFR